MVCRAPLQNQAELRTRIRSEFGNEPRPVEHLWSSSKYNQRRFCCPARALTHPNLHSPLIKPMRHFIPVFALLLTCVSLCSAKTPNTLGRVERLDPAFDKIVRPGAKVEVLASGFTWTEGPVWSLMTPGVTCCFQISRETASSAGPKNEAPTCSCHPVVIQVPPTMGWNPVPMV